MTDIYNNINRKYQYVVLEGNNYEIGKQQAELIKDNPYLLNFLTKRKAKPQLLGFSDHKSQIRFYDEWCPGIIDEFQGFADELQVPLQNLALFDPPIFVPGNCSHMATLSSITQNKHVYVGRSYEWNQDQSDFRLISVNIKKKIKHMGFSEFLFLRDDGINEHGLCVTISGGGTNSEKVKDKKQGFMSFFIARAILEHCKNVQEAVEYLEKVPVEEFWNFLVTDKNDNAAIFQFFNGEYTVKRINKTSEEQFLVAGNHYFLPGMEKYQEYAIGPWILKNSKARLELMKESLSKHSPNITNITMKNLQSKEMYNGLCGHYYSDFFGTLFSVVYDLTDLTLDVCFGAPTHNNWYEFSLNDPLGVKTFDAVLPNKSMTSDKYWG
jgi:predicted choloylglycine hydrolase